MISPRIRSTEPSRTEGLDGLIPALSAFAAELPIAAAPYGEHVRLPKSELGVIPLGIRASCRLQDDALDAVSDRSISTSACEKGLRQAPATKLGARRHRIDARHTGGANYERRRRSPITDA